LKVVTANRLKQISKNLLFSIFLLAFTTFFGQTQELDSLKNLIQRSNKDHMTYLLAMGQYYTEEDTQDVDSIRYYANTLLKIPLGDLKNLEESIEAEYLLGHSEMLELAYPKAVIRMQEVIRKYFEKAYELAKKHKESENIILDLLLNLCTEYQRISDYGKMSEIMEKAVPNIDKTSVPASVRCHFYLNAGKFNLVLGNHKQSIEQFHIALQIAEKSENVKFQMTALMNLGILYGYFYEKNYEKALTYFERGIKLIEANPFLQHRHSMASYYLGQNYYYLKNYSKAITILENALEELKKSDGFDYVEALTFLGYSYKKNNQPVASNKALNLASKKFYSLIEECKKKRSYKNEVSWSYMRLSNIDSALGNFDKSLANYKLFKIYRDSINEETKFKISERLDFVRKTAEKDKRIDHLTNQNKIQLLEAEQQTIVELALFSGFILLAILLTVLYNRFRLKKRAFRIIKIKNEENKLLIREVHHRVKNNLQIILSLLSAQKDSHIDNGLLRSVLTESLNKIRSMAIIHQNLYRGNNITKIQVDSYLGELINSIKDSIEKSDQKVDFQLDVDASEIKIGLAVPLGLILNELITNCYKYAFIDSKKETNKITIRFKLMENSQQFQLVFKDNGVGLPKDFCAENSPSFGMQLVQGLVEQLNGKIEMVTDEGTNFEIYLEEPVAA